MSDNKDRIAKWHARRQAEQASRAAHPTLPKSYALVATQAEALVSGTDDKAEPLLELVLDGLRGLPNETIPQRRQLYDAVTHGIERGIEQSGSHSDYAELRRRQLRAIIRMLETDARNGIAVIAQGYWPTEFEDAVGPLLAGYQRRRQRSEEADFTRLRREALLADEVFTMEIPAEDEADLSYLRQTLTRIDAERHARASHPVHPTMDAWRGLLRYQFTLLRSESGLALLWLLLGPAIIIGIVSMAYFVTGTRNILNMDVPTFALVGTTTWFMFRNITFRTSTSFRSKRALHNFRMATPAMTGVSEGVIYMLSYAAVYPALIGGGHLLGLFTLPHDVLAVSFWIVCFGIVGLTVGTIFGALTIIWPFFARIAPVIERATMVFSGVFLVSEQLPSEYRGLILWSPFSHGMQLLRSSYFEAYQSQDADPEYFFVWVGLLIILAVASQHAVRSRTAPA